MDIEVTKIMLVHALNGGRVPYDEPEFVKVGLLRYAGRGNNPFDYVWVTEELMKLNMSSLYELYKRFNS